MKHVDSHETSLPSRVIQTLGRYGSIVELREGSVLFHSGDPAEEMFLIEEGRMRVELEDGLRVLELGPGAVLGELALFVQEHRRSGDAVAITPVRLRVLGRAAFAQLSADRPDVALELVRGMAGYLLESERRLLEGLRRRTEELELTLRHLRRTREDLNAAEIRAMTDPLTGLYNRRAFEHHLKLVEAQGKRSEPKAALLLADLDHFKEINDRHGHVAGDMVLRHVSRVLERSIRTTDLPFRIGGDELAVLALGAGAQEAKLLGRRILSELTADPLTTDGAAVEVSLSFGGTLFQPGESLIETVQRADLALYEAKKEGRGCLRWLSPPG